MSRLLGARRCGKFLHYFGEAETRRFLARGKLLERLQEFPHIDLSGHQQERAVDQPVVIGIRRGIRALIGVAAKVEDQRHAKLD